ncbi:MAG: zeta toxin family protein [Candidatus Saccharimonadales bacterium]
MRIDISPEEFDRLSNEKKKKYIAQLFIRKSGAKPVNSPQAPIAFVMAGLPGAGKTEFLDTISEEVVARGFDPFVRIDLDEIVSVYPDYTPRDYYKFRSQGNLVLARTIDESRHGRYNMLIDGTFSGLSGASVKTVSQLLRDGYRLNMVYMYDSADSAWYYTKKRKLETGRSVDRDGFIRAVDSLTNNIRQVVRQHDNNPLFSISAVVQKELRDKKYHILTQKQDIDKIINLDYNLDNIRKDVT